MKRGCGERIQGGIYIEVALSENGMPIEFFLYDPTKPLGELVIPTQGVLVERQGDLTLIFDWIGAQFYPNATDWIEEVRRFGVSARVPKTTKFSEWTDKVYYFPVHPNAILVNPRGKPAIGEELGMKNWEGLCPKNKNEFHDCNGKLWSCVHPLEYGDDGKNYRIMPSFKYRAENRVECVGFESGILGCFPVTNLAVINGIGAAEAFEIAKQAPIPVMIKEE